MRHSRTPICHSSQRRLRPVRDACNISPRICHLKEFDIRFSRKIERRRNETLPVACRCATDNVRKQQGIRMRQDQL